MAQQNSPPTAADLARQKLQEQVQHAFALGWHMAELFHFEKVGSYGVPPARAPKSRAKRPHRLATAELAGEDQPSRMAAIEAATKAMLDDALPGLGSLKAEERRSLLIRQVKHDIDLVWIQTDPPLAAELKAQVDTAAAADSSGFGSGIEALHKILLEGLTVSEFRIGKSYGLGRALAETVLIPCAVASSRGVEGLSSDRDKGIAVKTALLGMFEGDRVFTIQGWLLDLRDWFDEHSADAVSTTLGGWGFWMFRPTMDGTHIDFDWGNRRTRLRTEAALRRQGDMWRGLLSGEKNPMDIAGPTYYFAAMASVVRKVAGLAWSFLGTGIGLLLFILLIVAGAALYISATAKDTTGILSAVVALLTTLGVTAGSAGAAVQKAWAQAEGPLWDAEVSAAIANAAWQNPAPMGSVEAIQLLLAVGEKANARTETLARHPNLVVVRNIPVGRIGIILAVVTTAISVFEADAHHLNRDASFFLPPLVVVAFLVLIDGWDILIGLATKQTAPYLALPDRIELPEWIMPVAQVLAPVFLLAGLLAGHFFWH